MTTLKTVLNERAATETPFTPTAEIAASNVQNAIEAVEAAAAADLAAHVAAADPHPQYLTAAEGDALFLTAAEGNAAYQPLDADLTSWAGVTRAAGFDTFAATPSSANLRSLLTDESGTGDAYFQGGALGTPSSGTLTNCTGLPTAGLVDDAVTDAKLRNSGALSVIGRSANSSGDPADISAVAASGAVLRESGSTIGFGTVATAGITDDAITNGKLANMATSTLKGRLTAATGDPEDLTIGSGFSATGTTLNVNGALKSVQVFTGSGTWTRPAGITRVVVEVIGGGGGGGGVAVSSASNATVGAGGGAGAYAIKLITSPASTETVTVGAAGAGGAAGNNNGSSGGTSSFGTHVSCTGGAGGQGTATNSRDSGNFATTPGSGGTATGGDVNIGGQGGTFPAYGTATNALFLGSGAGGSCPRGGFGAARQAQGAAGIAAVGYGGGGSGAVSYNASGSARAGGDGAPGLVIVWEFS